MGNKDQDATIKRLQARYERAVADQAINVNTMVGLQRKVTLEVAAKIADSNAHEDCDVAEAIAAAIRAKAKEASDGRLRVGPSAGGATGGKHEKERQ